MTNRFCHAHHRRIFLRYDQRGLGDLQTLIRIRKLPVDFGKKPCAFNRFIIKPRILDRDRRLMLAIGMALTVKPTLLLLDEPLLGLSPMMQQVVMDAIIDLNNTWGITVVLSEQFARPVLPVIDRGYVVENGMLTLTGTGAELMSNPEIKAAYFGV